MGKFEKVLIASDFDGTLKNDDGIITADVRSAIAYFISEGGYFTVCTGRTYQGFHLYDPSYINAPVLLTNGSMAYDYEKNEPVFVNGIEAEQGIPFVRAIMEKFPEVSIEMYPFDSTYAIHLDDTSHRHFTSQGIPYEVVNDPSETKFPWAKAMFAAEGISQEVQTFMRENFDDPAFLPTNGGYIEVMKKAPIRARDCSVSQTLSACRTTEPLQSATAITISRCSLRQKPVLFPKTARRKHSSTLIILYAQTMTARWQM